MFNDSEQENEKTFKSFAIFDFLKGSTIIPNVTSFGVEFSTPVPHIDPSLLLVLPFLITFSCHHSNLLFNRNPLLWESRGVPSVQNV